MFVVFAIIYIHVFAVAPFLLAARYNVPRMCFVNKMDREAWMHCETWYEVVSHAMLRFFLELFWTSRMNISIKWTLNMMECLLARYPFCLGCHSAWLGHAGKSVCLAVQGRRFAFENGWSDVCLNFQGCWCNGMCKCMSVLLAVLDTTNIWT